MQLSRLLWRQLSALILVHLQLLDQLVVATRCETALRAILALPSELVILI